MSREIIKERERAFEYEFCQKVDQEFPQPRGEKLHVNERLQALADATGIVDQSVLLELDEIGINSNFVGALSLYPLVYVAWADRQARTRGGPASRGNTGPQSRQCKLSPAGALAGESTQPKPLHRLERLCDGDPRHHVESRSEVDAGRQSHEARAPRGRSVWWHPWCSHDL